MSFKKDIPDMHASWDDLLYHSGWAYPTQGEAEIECTVVDSTHAEIAGWSVDVSEALRLIEFYQEKPNEEGPCGLMREVTFSSGGSDSTHVPSDIVGDIIQWTKHALGVEPYEGPADRWEGD